MLRRGGREAADGYPGQLKPLTASATGNRRLKFYEPRGHEFRNVTSLKVDLDREDPIFVGKHHSSLLQETRRSEDGRISHTPQI